MLQRDIIGLPTNLYPIDPWALVETSFSDEYTPITETLFSISNGYLGARAVPLEGRPFVERGTFINGFHEQWSIQHAEEAYGFAKIGQTLIAAPDARRFHIYLDDEAFNVRTSHISDYTRKLCFKTGVLSRSLTWHLPTGSVARLESQSFISLANRHLIATRLNITMVKGSAPVAVSSQIRNEEPSVTDDWDPRKAKGFAHKVLIPVAQEARDRRQILQFKVAQSNMQLGCAIDHQISSRKIVTTQSHADEDRGKLVMTTSLEPGDNFEIVKYGSFHADNEVPSIQLADRCDRTLDRVMERSWKENLTDHVAVLADFWESGDVQIGGNDMVQQAVRWSLYQIFQNAARADGMGVPAKGLSGTAYEGHYFWDTEIYVLPMLVYSQPRLARNLLLNRYSMLDKSRERAAELNEDGALFPWRTITGDEASAYYEAGTAQYHINADIAYAIDLYVSATGDYEFIELYGAEMLVETARMWASLGFHDTDGFHIHGVTGPDEYTTVVDDNAYTNLMAAHNLAIAAQAVNELETRSPDSWRKLVSRTRLHPGEVEAWQHAAKVMYIPYDTNQQITPQDAHFLGLQPWNWEDTPQDKYPLLLNFHPLVIYRHQVTKQADVVLAMFLQEDKFDLDLMRSNFDYYDPITTGDSSLSTSVQSIIASRIGNLDKATEYFRYGAFMDMANIAGNTQDGVHVAAAGGVWLSTVCGFGGFKMSNKQLSFSPRLPSSWDSLTYQIMIATTNSIQVEIIRGEVTYTYTQHAYPHHTPVELLSPTKQAQNGDHIEILHEGKPITLPTGQPVTVTITSTWEEQHQDA